MIKWRRRNALFPDRCTARPILLRNELLPNYILMCWKQLPLVCVSAPSFPPVRPFPRRLRKFLSSWPPAAVRVTEEEWEKPVLIMQEAEALECPRIGGRLYSDVYLCSSRYWAPPKRTCKLYLFNHSFSCNLSNNFMSVWVSCVCWTAALAVLQN